MKHRGLLVLGLLVAALAAAAGGSGALGAAGQAARLTLSVGLGAGVLGTLLGGAVAAAAYVLGGLPERVLNKVLEAPLALPLAMAPLLLGERAAGGARLFVAFLLLRAAQAGQQLLTEAQALGGQGHIEAARALGAPRGRLLVRHLAPQLRPSALDLCVRGAALAVPMELLLAPLGLGGGLGEQVARSLGQGEQGPLVAACLAAAGCGALLSSAAEALGAQGRGRG